MIEQTEFRKHPRVLIKDCCNLKQTPLSRLERADICLKSRDKTWPLGHHPSTETVWFLLLFTLHLLRKRIWKPPTCWGWRHWKALSVATQQVSSCHHQVSLTPSLLTFGLPRGSVFVTPLKYSFITWLTTFKPNKPKTVPYCLPPQA